jgi:hypothetical protein
MDYYLIITFFMLINGGFCQTNSISFNDGFYYLNNEKFFVKGIGYEAGAIPGQLPWEREFDEELLRFDMNRIVKAGFNTIRTWAPLTEEELSVIDDYDLYILMGIWIDPEGNFNDPDFIAEAINIVDSVLIYSKGFDNIIAYLIMNEPLPGHIFSVGFQNTVNLWNELINIIHEEHPGVPVSIANTCTGTFIDPEIFDFSAYNVYQYNPVTVNHTHYYTGYVEYLKNLRGDDAPLIITECGLSVSPSGPGGGGYGGNTVVEQMEGNRHMFRSLIDGGAGGACIFNYSDGWWKAGNPYSHDDNPEEWFGMIEYQNVTDKYGIPRLSWLSHTRFNNAIVTLPKNDKIYYQQVPIEIFFDDTVSHFKIKHLGTEIYSSTVNSLCFTDTLILQDNMKDYSLNFSFYDDIGNNVAGETINILVADQPILIPELELNISISNWNKPEFVDIYIDLQSNGSLFIPAQDLNYATYRHEGFSYGNAFVQEVTFNNNVFNHTYTEYITEATPVVTFSAGFGFSYGTFNKWIYDQQQLVFEGYLTKFHEYPEQIEENVIVYPNPADQYFAFMTNSSNICGNNFKVFNLSGSIVFEGRVMKNNFYETGHLQPGLYILTIEGNIFSAPLVRKLLLK